MRNLKNIIIVDACQSKVRIGIAQNGVFKAELETDKQAMESFLESLKKLLENEGLNLAQIDAFALCVGPGSILSTRVASAAISTISKVTNAKIFTWDVLQCSAFALAKRLDESSILLCAPSKKGFANIVSLQNGKILFQKEISLDTPLAHNARLLNQKKTTDLAFEKLERVEFSIKEIWNILIDNETLLEETQTPPNAKSLSERNYIKWKAPALI